MKHKQEIKTLSRFIAGKYEDIAFCPLEEEKNLLISAGDQSGEALFEACHMVFGLNMNRVFHEICIDTVGYCDLLHEMFEDDANEEDMERIIGDAGKRIAAIDYLAEHAPMNSLEDRAMMASRIYAASLCHQDLKRRYRSCPKAYKKQRT